MNPHKNSIPRVKRTKEEKESLSKQLFIAPRDEKFKNFIKSLLSQTDIKTTYIDTLITKGLKYFEAAFTHSSVDSKNNYEYYEWIGDQICSVTVCKYFKRKFVYLQTEEGVKYLSRLKITYCSKAFFSMFADKLNLIDYISSDMLTRLSDPDSLKEDVFEAFIGVTDHLFDTFIMDDTGYRPIATFLKKLLDQCDISLKYEDLYDSITRLKELFDNIGDGNMKYNSNTKNPNTYEQSFEVTVAVNIAYYTIICNQNNTHNKSIYNISVPDKCHCGSSVTVRKKYDHFEWSDEAKLLKDARHKASEKTLVELKKLGIYYNPHDRDNNSLVMKQSEDKSK